MKPLRQRRDRARWQTLTNEARPIVGVTDRLTEHFCARPGSRQSLLLPCQAFWLFRIRHLAESIRPLTRDWCPTTLRGHAANLRSGALRAFTSDLIRNML